MSASNKFDLSSRIADRPLYTSGHRGSFVSALLAKSASFHENVENPLLSSLPNMNRSSSSITQGDVLNFFQCVRFDPKSMVVDHKLNRPAEFKRLASAAVGFPLEDPQTVPTKSKQLSAPSPEDLRRLKSGVRESGTKARERVKIFNDCLSVINKCFPSIPSRKRSRLDNLCNDRSNTMLPVDRASVGTGIGKVGSQNHANTGSFELEQQKSEERSKNAFPNKRTRTSMADVRIDVRAHTTSKLLGSTDRDKDFVRISNSNVVQVEDRILSMGVDGWEKSKMKKKRTGMKSDVSPSSMATKPIDHRETKQGIQPRLSAEARQRLAESHGFRPAISNGGLGLGKAEATSQVNSGIRSSLSRSDSGNSSLHERRERSNGQEEKERVNLKVLNKVNSRDDLSSGSHTLGSKMNGNVRAPRSGSVGGVSKLIQAGQRSTSSNDWELSNCTSKFPGIPGANNRKRTPSGRSSSPPADNQVQRPQKISRTARRTNLLPIDSRTDDNPALDTTSEVSINDRCIPAHSPQPVKIKMDTFSPAALSETEESGAPEIKSRDKNTKGGETDEKSIQNVQKMSSLPPRKNRAVNGLDQGNGVRKQGRTGRGFSSSRSLLPMTSEKHGNIGTTKQMRSSRLVLEKSERAGRPPTRKLSDRKPQRQKHVVMNMTADFLVSSENGHEELLAAASAVTDRDQILSIPFWKKMELFFRFISDEDISYLKEQMSRSSAVDATVPDMFASDSSTLLANGCPLNEFDKEESETGNVDPGCLALCGVKTHNEISLYQRLVAAFISVEGSQDLCYSDEDLKYEVYESQHEMEKDTGSVFCPMVSQSCYISGYPSCNSNGINPNGKSIYKLNNGLRENNGTPISDYRVIPSYDHFQNGLNSDQFSLRGKTCSDYQYYSMNERILMEVHSIGIYPDLTDGDESINEDIIKMDREYHEQFSRKKCLLGKLFSCSDQAKELQEKDFEIIALEKLVGMAYEKYMNSRGPNVQGMKSANKMARQASLAFVKRTLERCHEFELTGKSCFNEPLYKDIFISGLSRLIDEQPVNSNTDNEASKPHLRTSIEARTSAPTGIQQSPSHNQDIYYDETFPSSNLYSGQNSGKKDIWSSKVKQRELLLDEVGITSPGASSGLAGSLLCGTKGKRTERDRDGKVSSRDVLSRSGNNKIVRPASSVVKGERKSKAKPKQKNIHPSAINGPLGKMTDQPKVMLPTMVRSCDIKENDVGKDRNDYAQDMLEDPIDLSGLQLPEMDPTDFDGQGGDIGSWLDIEDDGLQDHDYMGGLEIPMDDLTHLNMMI